jgi:hypothetical protein
MELTLSKNCAFLERKVAKLNYFLYLCRELVKDNHAEITA